MARISKIYRILISGLLTLLGFSFGSCFPAPEYGAPTATYKAKGVVVSEVGNSPIKGIRAVLKHARDDEYSTIATVFTNSAGSFSLEGRCSPREKLYVKLTDIDEEANGGSFTEREIEADYTNVTLTGGNNGHWWYEGEAELNLGTITMTPQ